MGWYTSSTVGFHLLMFPPQLSYSHPKTWQFRPAIGENASASNCLPFSHRETSSSSSLKYSFLSCCRTKFKFTSGEVGRYEMIYTCIYIYINPHPLIPPHLGRHASFMHPPCIRTQGGKFGFGGLDLANLILAAGARKLSPQHGPVTFKWRCEGVWSSSVCVCVLVRKII